jgi:HPt (histidine-containing phosphotransfer) domain-containing protein
MFSELAQLFFEDTSSGLAALRGAVEVGDARTVERVAHTLKGSSGNMGAARMAKICSGIQEVGTSGDLSRAPELLEGLEGEFGRVRLALGAEVEGSRG